MQTTFCVFLGHFENNGIVTWQKYTALTQMENTVHFCANKTTALIPHNFQNTVTVCKIGVKVCASAWIPQPALLLLNRFTVHGEILLCQAL